MMLKNILISLIAIGIVVILPHSGLIPLPFAYSIPVLLFIYLYLKYYEETLSDLGFSLKFFNVKALLIGSLIAILIVCCSQLILFPLLDRFVEFKDVDVDMYHRLRGNTGFYIFIVIMSWIIGGVYEEIVFHGFVFTRLEKIIPGKHATQLGFLMTAIIFGLYHVQLGGADAINALLVGAAYHALILYYNRNLWYGIFCHAAYDTIVVTLLYLGYL